MERKVPLYLQTYKFTKFKNTLFQVQLPEYKIKFYTSENDDIKAAIVEIFNQTLKTRMYRYFSHSKSYRYDDVLQVLVHSYNHSYHRSIGMAPASVNVKNERLVRQKLFYQHLENQHGGTTSVNEWELVSESKHSRKATCPDGRNKFSSSGRNFPLLRSLTRSKTYGMMRQKADSTSPSFSWSSRRTTCMTSKKC